MIKIEMNRNEALTLLQELPANHWLESRVLKVLVESADSVKATSIVEENRKPLAVKTADKSDNRCIYTFYGNRCEGFTDGFLCQEHAEESCSYRDEFGSRCGSQINHGCPEELQFVCGAPLCASHNKCRKH